MKEANGDGFDPEPWRPIDQTWTPLQRPEFPPPDWRPKNRNAPVWAAEIQDELEPRRRRQPRPTRERQANRENRLRPRR
jgi:hypothetical protein